MKDDYSVKVNLVDDKENKGESLAGRGVKAYINVDQASKLIGGGANNILKIKIYPRLDKELTLFDYYPEAISKVEPSWEGSTYQLRECYFLDADITDENGTVITPAQLREALRSGKDVQIIYCEHLGDLAVEDGDSYAFAPIWDNGEFTSLLPTSCYFTPQNEPGQELWDLSTMGLVSCWINTNNGFMFYPCGLAVTGELDEIGGSFAVIYDAGSNG